MLLGLDGNAGVTLLAAVISGAFLLAGSVLAARKDIGRRNRSERTTVPSDQAPTDDNWHHLIDQDIGGLKEQVRTNTALLGRVVDYLHSLGWEGADE